jgi:homoserine kinase type II
MAVYTQLSHEEIKTFLAIYPLPGLATAEGIRAGVSNTNYRLIFQDDTKAILTLFENRVTENDIPFFVGLMEHMANNAIPCPKPIHAHDGNAIQSLKDKPALLVTFLEGKDVNSIENIHVKELGTALAKMHIAAASYTAFRNNTLSAQGWKTLYAHIGNRLNELTPGLEQEIQTEITTLEKEWPRDLPSGVIHADIFPDNVFFDFGNRLTGIIDFYFACNDFFAYDLAITLNAWCFEKDFSFNIEKAKVLLSAYQKLRPLSESELQALPILARGAALRFLLTRAHDTLYPEKDALITLKDPLEYIAKLRFFGFNPNLNL